MKQEELKQKFLELPALVEAHKEYLRSRAIDPNKVGPTLKSDGDYICCLLLGINKDGELDYTTYQRRNVIAKDKASRFDLPPGSKMGSVFVDILSPKKDYIIIVEGMFDFLTVLQYESNVVGMFNSTSKEAISIIKKIILDGGYKRIFMIPDNDQAGEKLLKDIEEAIGPVGVFDLKQFDVKDVNDLAIKMGKDFSIEDMMPFMNEGLKEKKQAKLNEILKQKEELIKDINIIDTQFKSGNPIERPVSVLNKEFQSILPNEMVVLVGAAGSGKTTFTFSIIRHNLNLGHKIGLLSYEMKIKDIRNNYFAWKIPGCMDRMMKSQLTQEDELRLTQLSNPLFTHDNFFFSENLDVYIEDVEQDIRNLYSAGVNVFIIDNLVKIRGKSKNEFKDNEDVIRLLYSLCKSLKICIIVLHHADKASSVKKGKNIAYRGSGNIQNFTDRMVIMSRPAVNKEEPSPDDKAEVDFLQAKQRYGGMGMGNRVKIYYHQSDYYSTIEAWAIASGRSTQAQFGGDTVDGIILE